LEGTLPAVGFVGWSEPGSTSAPVQDEAIQAVLGMSQKHILFLCPRDFSAPFLPQNFSFLLASPSPTSIHLISPSFHLQSLGELPSLSSTKL